jgi:diguanylate cyclase (GGDEF)-like protein
MRKSLRRWGVVGIVALLLSITLWNRVRGLEGAVFGLYYVPIFAAALLFTVRAALSTAVLSVLGICASVLWRDGALSLPALIARPDLLLEVPLYMGFAVLIAGLAHRSGNVDALASADPLTGVLDRNFLLERLGEEVQRARHDGQPLALLLINIDRFGQLNDDFGSERCDDALRSIASAVRSCIRAVDVPGRTKGKEFAVVLPETPLAGALLVAERIRKAVQDFGAYSGLFVTVSVGVVDIDLSEPREPTTFLAQADDALFEAQRTGRNRVVAFDPEMHHAF